MPDMSAVGNAASASKDATGLNGDEVFSGRVSINRSDNGGFILSVSYEKRRKGNQRGQNIPSYCPDKQLTFDTWEAASAAIDKLYGSSDVSSSADAAPSADTGAADEA